MNSHHRGVYQPLMENVPIYDLSDEEVEEEERSRLPLLIVIAFIVLAAFAGVVWLAYNQGVARGRARAVVIAAPEGPVRTAPADAGGAPTPYTGLKVYNQPVPPDQEAQSTALAPLIQTARPEPAVTAQPAARAPAARAPAAPGLVAPQTAASAPVKPAATTDAPPIRLSPESPAAIAAPARPAPVSKPAAPAAAAAAPKAVADAKAPVATRSAVAGGAVLQIGAYDSEDIANAAWTAFRGHHAGVAGPLAQDVQKVDLGAKGIWYRLRVGPFADKAAAAAACEKLKAEGATCFVTAP